MSLLIIIIAIKFIVTLVLVAIPFLMFPMEKLDKISGMAAKSNTFYRLYGVAMVALLIGYVSGIPLINHGIFPWSVVIMGIVSNGGVALLLLKSGPSPKTMKFIMIDGGIAIALITCVIFPKLAISTLF